jgi:hypothetical protein
MKNNPRLRWIAANALGLGVGFLAFVQTVMFGQYGFDFERHWVWGPPGQDVSVYVALLVGFLVAGAILGSAQALVLRSLPLRVAPWILATSAGFGLTVVIDWPLLAAGILGRIPGPVEPLIATVGGASLAGLVQYVALRRQGIVATKWLALWIGGLLASLVPTALLFMFLGGLGVSPSWPIEVFLNGLMVGGVAAMISGNALFAAFPRHGQTQRVGRTPAAEPAR